MSPEMYTIISVAIGLAVLIHNGQVNTRRSLLAVRAELNDFRSEVHREFAEQREAINALAERVARQ